MNVSPKTPNPAWSARAPQLADWAMKHVFVRLKRFGGYLWEKGELVKRTLPRNGPEPDAVNRDLLIRHFRAEFGTHVVGAHSLTPEGENSRGRAATADIDAHGAEDDPALNERYAVAKYKQLAALGFRPLLAGWGEGSFHESVIFDRLVPGATLYAFAAWMVSDALAFGFAKPVESFPKQSAVEEGLYGNWLRVVGAHHKRDVWARVYDGTTWLEGAAAVSHILTLTGDHPDLIPAEAAPAPPAPPPPAPARPLPSLNGNGSAPSGPDVFEAFKAVATLEYVVSYLEQRRHTVIRRTADRVEFIRAGKKKDGTESFNVKLIDGVPLTFCFSSNAGLPENQALNPVQLRCFCEFGSLETSDMAKLAQLLRAEMRLDSTPNAPRVKMPGVKPAPAAEVKNVPAEDVRQDDDQGGPTDPENPESGNAPPPEDPPPPRAPTGDSAYPPPVNGEAWNDPHRLARLYLDDRRTAEGEPTLLQWRDEYHSWDGRAWRAVPGTELDAGIAKHCREVFEADYPLRLGGYLARKAKKEKEQTQEKGDKEKSPVLFAVTTPVKGNTKVNLSGLVNMPDTKIDAPFWRCESGALPDPSEVISAPNGLFTIAAVAAGSGPFSPPTPKFFTPTALPFPVQADPPEPTVWHRCVREWCNKDAKTILGLQEAMGLLLSSETRAQKIIMLVGPRRSGKGSVLRIITELVGARNVASTTFHRLGEDFGLQPLLGRTVATIPDARLSGRTDVATVVERLLSISGEDTQSVNRKNMPIIDSRLKVRFVVSTNVIPQLNDPSGATASRFHILSFPNSFLGKEDPGLEEKLRAELPGILVWAAKGFVRFVKQDYKFTENDAAVEYRRELDDLSSPVRAFARERCSIGPKCSVRVAELIASWQNWNELNHSEATSDGVFGKDLHAAFPHIEKSHPRIEGQKVRVYHGIGLRPRADWGDPETGEGGVEQAGTCSTLAHVKRQEVLDAV